MFINPHPNRYFSSSFLDEFLRHSFKLSDTIFSSYILEATLYFMSMQILPSSYAESAE